LELILREELVKNVVGNSSPLSKYAEMTEDEEKLETGTKKIGVLESCAVSSGGRSISPLRRIPTMTAARTTERTKHCGKERGLTFIRWVYVFHVYYSIF